MSDRRSIEHAILPLVILEVLLMYYGDDTVKLNSGAPETKATIFAKRMIRVDGVFNEITRSDELAFTRGSFRVTAL